MSLHRAAALALMLLAGCGTGLPVTAPEPTAWEIIQPPWTEGRPYPTVVDETAPLSKWVTTDRHTYPTQNECEQALASLRERLREGARNARVPQSLQEQFSKIDEKQRCVSIDDPALKSN